MLYTEWSFTPLCNHEAACVTGKSLLCLLVINWVDSVSALWKKGSSAPIDTDCHTSPLWPFHRPPPPTLPSHPTLQTVVSHRGEDVLVVQTPTFLQWSSTSSLGPAMCTQGMLWYAATLTAPPSSLTCPKWRREGIHRTRRCVYVMCDCVYIRMCIVWVCT